jgi:hypothetical protein
MPNERAGPNAETWANGLELLPKLHQLGSFIHGWPDDEVVGNREPPYRDNPSVNQRGLAECRRLED